MAQATDKLLVVVIVASQMAPPFMFSGVTVALPHMGVELNAGASSLGLVATSFLAGSVAFLLPVGRLADATDKRTIYKLGQLGFAVTTALIGLLSWMPGILLLRFVQGALTAALSAAGPALLADLVPAERRGRAYGASLGAIYAGLTLGPICAGVLLEHASWRAVFFVGAALVLLVFVPIALLLPSKWRRSSEPLHGWSTALILAAVGGLVGGSATLDRGALGLALIGGGVLFALVFVLVQRRLDDPLLDVRALVGHRVLRSALLVQLLLYLSAYCSVFVLSIYLQVSLGHSAETAGLMLAIGSVLMAVTAPIAGALSDRLRPRLITSLGVLAALGSALVGTQLGPDTPLGMIVVLAVLQGLGFGMFASPNMAIIMNSARAEAVSMASALAAKARSLGMIGGMLIGAVLISLELGDVPVEEHGPEFIGVTVDAFTVLAGLSSLALVLSILDGLRGPEKA